ncbi:MAG TPA: trigger factor [Thermodesulfatator atlanticus]|uniref:Trigger factor n=1 Tax=Thermodesulfatator atlanticus TaxID=501497 RepID=A0A7V5NY77_9BACT|nr:trigger factor [Thermodesulfatator atlanticus]
MKVNVEDISSVQKKLKVELPPEVVNKEIDRACQRLGKEVSVKGFRKGRVPKAVVKRLFREHIEEKVVENLIQESLPKAIEESKLVPIVRPLIESYGEVKEKEAFHYTAVVDIRPEIELSPEDYKGLEIEAMPVEVTEEELENHLRAIQMTFADLKPADKDHQIRENDIAIISFKAYIDGQPVPGHEAEALYVDVGTGEFNATIEEKLIGKKAGDTVEVDVTYPEDSLNAQLAGQTVHYQVYIREIYVRDLKPLDDEFIKKMNLGFESVEHLRERIKRRLEEDKKKKADEFLKEQILAQLREKVKFEVPERYVEYKLARLIEQMEQSLQEKGHTFESAGISVQKLRERLRPLAEQQAREDLILEKIAELENITVSGEELEEKAKALAEATRASLEEARAILATSMVPRIIADKTLQFLVSQAKIKETQKQEEVKDKTPTQENQEEKQPESEV